MTEMACQEDRMTSEAAYLAAVDNSGRLTWEATEEYITGSLD